MAMTWSPRTGTSSKCGGAGRGERLAGVAGGDHIDGPDVRPVDKGRSPRLGTPGKPDVEDGGGARVDLGDIGGHGAEHGLDGRSTPP